MKVLAKTILTGVLITSGLFFADWIFYDSLLIDYLLVFLVACWGAFFGITCPYFEDDE